MRVHGRTLVQGLGALSVGFPLSLIGTLALLGLASGNVPLWPNAFFLGALGLGAIAVHGAARLLERRTLEVDDEGIRLRFGGVARWGVPWDHVRAVTSHADILRGGSGFVVVSGVRSYAVSQAGGFRSAARLKEAFTQAARYALARGAIITDEAGWAPELRGASERRAAEQGGVRFALEGEWVEPIDTGRVQGSDLQQVGLMLNITSMQIGVLTATLGGRSTVWPVGLLLFGYFALRAGRASGYFAHLVGLRYDASGLAFRYDDGSEHAYAWKDVKGCSYDRHRLVLLLRVPKSSILGTGARGGRFARVVGEGVHRRFAAARAGPASPR